MRTQNSQSARRSSRRGPRRPRQGGVTSTPAPVKQTFWQKVTSFFSGSPAKSTNSVSTPSRRAESPRLARKPEFVEVSSPKLYVGNLSFDAAESDLFDLFSGVGSVQNAEVVSHKHNQRSKGFAFVTMQSVDEAKRAVTELHDKEFMGRKLVVSGAKTNDSSSNRRNEDY
jgi:RNA recognition motif-containing protein